MSLTHGGCARIASLTHVQDVHASRPCARIALSGREAAGAGGRWGFGDTPSCMVR